MITRLRHTNAKGLFVGSVRLALPDPSAGAGEPPGGGTPGADTSKKPGQGEVATAPRELVFLVPAFAALLVFLGFVAVSTTVGNGTGASTPNLTSAAGALAALVLGLVINPRPGPSRTFQVAVWALLAAGALGVGVLAAVEVFDSDRHSAGAALTAAIAAFGGLFLDASKITHTAPVAGSTQTGR